jgi:hypothetical protein
LIGARVIDIVNKSFEYISPDLDFEAVYEVEQVTLTTEQNNDAVEKLRVSSIGDLVIEQKGDLLYSSLHGTGEYYIFEESDQGESETTIQCTDLWINTTISGSKVITETISILGKGTMTADYLESLTMDIDIKKMELITENRVELKNYIYGEGTFSGSVTDPSSDLVVSLDGDVYMLTRLLGHGVKKNYLGNEYTCSIQFTNITLDGQTGSEGGMVSTPFYSVVENTTWNADYEKYSNNTIYYEYYSYAKIANIEESDSGTGTPDNSPIKKHKITHITDVLVFETARPKVLLGQDRITLKSDYGVELELEPSAELSSYVGGKKFECVDIKGEVVKGGKGSVNLRLIRSGTFAGLTVQTVQEFYWKDEELTIDQTLKSIKAT